MCFAGTDNIQERDDAVFEDQDDPMESTQSSDDATMIDPALLTPEHLGSGSAESSVSADSDAAVQFGGSLDHDGQVSKKPVPMKLVGRSHITKDIVASNDASASGPALAAGTSTPVNGAANSATTDEATAMNAATKNMAIVEDSVAVDPALAVGGA